VSDALQVLGEHRFVEVEDALDDLCRRYPLSVLCQYERPAAAGERLLRATALHEDGVVDSLLRATVDEDVLRVRGEVDVTNAHVLRTLVETAAYGREGVLQVDLSGLTFLSASGCRALLDGTSALRAAGGVLRLVGARQNVRRVVALAGLGPGVDLRPDVGA
jgi:anti-anti-sigma factor